MRALALAVLAACGHTAAPPTPSNHTSTPPATAEDTPPCPPADWHPEEMAKVALADVPTALRSIRVLAWSQTVDDRPLYIDTALLWIEAADHQITLAHLYRHPKDDNTWEQAMIFDLPGFEGVRMLDHPATHAELEDFLAHSSFEFAAESGFKLIRAGVCRGAWMQSFHEAPWHAYPR